ncbi:recombinase family protein [Rossellomorea marisflavi]|uniref:recombinase family protein n=1 Tax=Rossellomorea marisflavi TaxID=189381 RepID=UPI003D2EE876
MKTSFAYIRRSSYKQIQNNSIEIQKQHIQEFAKRNQLYVPDELIFIEDTTSAFNKPASKRKQLMTMGERMAEMNISTVIFHDISRMDRTAYSFILDFYRPMKVRMPALTIFTTDTNKAFDPNNVEVKMGFLLHQQESEIKSERAIGNLTSDLESIDPFRPGSRTPYGYTQIDKKLEPNSDSEIVSFIFFLSSWGKSLVKIAEILNELGIPSPNKGTWRSSTIENILKNLVYLGKLSWNVQNRKDNGQKTYTFEETHSAITNELHLQIIKQNIALQRSYGRIDTPFLFLNKIKCRECNERLNTQNGSTRRKGVKYTYHYYVCKECGYKIDIVSLHNEYIPIILKHVQNLVSSTKLKPFTLNLIEQSISKIKADIDKKEQLIQTLLLKQKNAEGLDDKEIQQRIREFINDHSYELNQYKTTLENQCKAYQLVQSGQFFESFAKIAEQQLGNEEKRLIILYFVEHVIISDNNAPQVLYKQNVFSDFLNHPIG